MLKNYFKIAFRNLRRNKSYAIINIAGLSVAIASCLLIFLYIQDERSYDRFHENADRIYRVLMPSHFGGSAQIPAGAKKALASFPEVETAVRLYPSEHIVLKDGGDAFREKHFFYADSTFFDVFSFPLVQGDAAAILSEPQTMVLTEATAQKYFGDSNPVGRSLTFRDGQTFKVTGVMEDIPHNSTIKIDFLASFTSLNEPHGLDYQGYLYMLLHSSKDVASLESKFQSLTEASSDRVVQKIGFHFQDLGFKLQPITDVHLYPALSGSIKAQSDVRYLYIFGAVGIIILIIASINYMNLATAGSSQRAQEVGMRKVLGAQRQQIMGQFFAESILFAALAFLIALSIAQLVLPFFNAWTDKSLHFFDVQSWRFIGGSMLFVLCIGLLSGSYPVLVLSRFSPQRILKGINSLTHHKPRLRQALVIFQFSVTIALIAGTFIIKSQLHFIQQKRLGYESEHVISVSMTEPLSKRLYSGQIKPDQQRISTFKQALAGVPGVKDVSVAYSTPNGYLTSDVTYRGQAYNITNLPVDYDYIPTMNMDLIAGRNFSMERATDSTKAIIINETAARLFNLKDKVGQPIDLELGYKDAVLIGIVKDFNTASLHWAIGPTILKIEPSYYSRYILALKAGSLPGVLGRLKSTWKNIAPDYPFNYQFLDDQLQAQYRNETRTANTFAAFSTLAIIIACLGLFGLAAFSAQRRTKEVGIRKVLGATVSNIVGLLSKDFLKLVAIGFIIAVPIAWYAMNQWLADFAYKIDIGPGIFLLAGGLALLIALATVSWQSIRAALVNPAQSLRSE